MGAATTEGNLDVANMLKPFLARNDIKVIGATTLDEYHKTIENDTVVEFELVETERGPQAHNIVKQ